MNTSTCWPFACDYLLLSVTTNVHSASCLLFKCLIKAFSRCVLGVPRALFAVSATQAAFYTYSMAWPGRNRRWKLRKVVPGKGHLLTKGCSDLHLRVCCCPTGNELCCCSMSCCCCCCYGRRISKNMWPSVHLSQRKPSKPTVRWYGRIVWVVGMCGSDGLARRIQNDK